MPEPFTVAELVQAATRGDQHAWDQIVVRYMPLVSSVISKYRLSGEDAQDVNQTLWLRLVEHLDDIREPRAVPAWIVTTTRNEALRVLAARRRSVPTDPQAGSELEPPQARVDMDDQLLREERQQALREGLAELKAHHRDLLLLLMTDPPLPYEQISARLGIAVGSIGPTRARALEQLRATCALRGLLATHLDSATPAPSASRAAASRAAALKPAASRPAASRPAARGLATQERGNRR